jgi:hypothetical protein
VLDLMRRYKELSLCKVLFKQQLCRGIDKYKSLSTPLPPNHHPLLTQIYILHI